MRAGVYNYCIGLVEPCLTPGRVHAWDVGGLAEPIMHYGAGRAVPPGDVEALTEAVRELLTDSAALAAARAGADRARRELTWDAAAASHLTRYEGLG